MYFIKYSVFFTLNLPQKGITIVCICHDMSTQDYAGASIFQRTERLNHNKGSNTITVNVTQSNDYGEI